MPYKLWDYESPTYLILLRIHELTLLTSLVLGFYFLFRIYNLGLIHVNLRILLCNIPLLFIVMNVSRIISYTWERYLERHPAVAIDPHFANAFCLTFRFTEEVAVGCLALSIPQIAFERAFATVFRRTYEKHGAKLGVGMTLQTYFGAVLFSLSVLSYQIFLVGDFKFDERHATCRLEAFPSLLPLYFGVWFTAVLITIGSITTLFVAYGFNRKQHEMKGSLHLSTRYQFQENVKTLRSLLPPISAYMISDLCGVGCILYILLHANITDRELANALQIIHIIPQGYCIFTVSWFMYSFAPLRQRVVEDVHRLLPKRSRCNRVESSELTSLGIQTKLSQDDHFSSLVGSWDVQFEAVKPKAAE